METEKEITWETMKDKPMQNRHIWHAFCNWADCNGVSSIDGDWESNWACFEAGATAYHLTYVASITLTKCEV